MQDSQTSNRNAKGVDFTDEQFRTIAAKFIAFRNADHDNLSDQLKGSQDLIQSGFISHCFAGRDLYDELDEILSGWGPDLPTCNYGLNDIFKEYISNHQNDATDAFLIFTKVSGVIASILRNREFIIHEQRLCYMAIEMQDSYDRNGLDNEKTLEDVISLGAIS